MNTPTLITTPTPKPREGAWLWMFKIFAGVMIIVLLMVHYVVNHLVAPGGLLLYADVIQYYRNPFIPIMEIVFLSFGVSHALVGMRSIILDLNPSERLLRIIDVVLVVLGAVAIVYGIWLVTVIVAQGR